MNRFTRRILSLILLALGAWIAAPGAAGKDKSDGNISLTVTSLERMPQYPPPPAPPRVFVVTAGAGHELAVLTLKVQGSTAFEDYKICAGATLVDADGTKHPAALSKPSKAGLQSEVWDTQVLAFPVKKDIKLKTLSVGEMTFDLSKVEEKS